MSQARKPTITVQVYEQFPRRRSDSATHQFTLDQVKKYLSPKPLRRAPPRNLKPAPPRVDAPESAADQQTPGQTQP